MSEPKPMNRACELCQGACCKYFIMTFNGLEKDDWDWISFHGKELGQRRVLFECKCRHLSDEGRCLIYKSRPWVCQKHPVGGPMCIEAVLHVHTTSGLAHKILKVIHGTDKDEIVDPGASKPK